MGRNAARRESDGARDRGADRRASRPPRPPRREGTGGRRAYFCMPGWATVSVAGVAWPTPRSSGRYMSSTSGGGTV
ncbi:hypothetical protein EDC50_0697 [Vulcaniibacterium tengchongense]|uniref:Uncharacterized protein n=1 Tax=Vulcaniibacterium tengchongense TaxID=1273429 RepID=A0A3N4VES0_9GAMM|nr:hypothetical protein EDC50_0697 [Vulcaniibacterium tengchongense]